ncbi:MAG: hypothetical protein ACLQU3_23045 [Limisphaerales bacterium]
MERQTRHPTSGTRRLSLTPVGLRLLAALAVVIGFRRHLYFTPA